MVLMSLGAKCSLYGGQVNELQFKGVNWDYSLKTVCTCSSKALLINEGLVSGLTKPV